MRISSNFLQTAVPAMACIAFAGCSDRLDTPSGILDANTVIQVVTQGASSGEPGTRTAMDPKEYASGEIGINWLPSDRIGAFGDKGSANVEFRNNLSAESSTATFGGNLRDGESATMAYYPYSSLAGNDPSALKGTLPAEQSFSTQTRAIEGDWKVGRPVGATGRFVFEHVLAFLRFHVDAKDSPLHGDRLQKISLNIPDTRLSGDFTLDMNTGTVQFADGEAPTLTMLWDDTPVLTEDSFKGFMSCAPVSGIAGKELTVSITTDRHIASFKAMAAVNALERNKYYDIPLKITECMEREGSDWMCENNPEYNREDAPWVSGLESRLACANYVFSLPDTPFMHKIRVADASQTMEVYNLPEGLTWNARRRLVEGKVSAPGDYTYSVEVRNADGSVAFSEGIKLKVSNNLHQSTPHMGWQSWNVLETKIDETSIKATADALVSNGYKDAGYIWLGIDDCWQNPAGTRDSNGVPEINSTKFPSGFKSLTDYIHSKGLKAGIYSDAGEITCASGDQAGGTMLGAYGYESAMAKAFTDWGFDKLKEDWFWAGKGDANGSLDPASTPLAFDLYGKMGTAIANAGDRILLSMCEWGIHEPWKWGAEVGASSWRVTYDHRDGWMGAYTYKSGLTTKTEANSENRNESGCGIGLYNTLHLMRDLWPYAGVNRFNDPDMLVVGIRGKGTSSNDLVYGTKGMSDDEYETEFAMWCMWSAPLLLTLDVRSSDINSHDVALLTNKELIAINQDAMGQQAEYIKANGNVWYFCKDLADGSVAIAAVNIGDNSSRFAINIEDYDALDPAATYSAREVIARKDAGTLSAGSPLSGILNKHATIVYRLKPNAR